MERRDRLERTIAGEPTDHTPVALWRHFPGDDQRAADLAASVIQFQRTYDWDFIKITPSSSYSVVDYGVQDRWEGHIEGTRAFTRRPISRSLDWTDLRALDPMRGELNKQLECTRLVTDAFGDDDVPVIQTIYSPLVQAEQIAGNELLIRHMRMQPDRLHSGLNAVTESTLRYIDALRRLPIAGIFYVIQHASYNQLSEEEYLSFGLPYDRKILESLPDRWWLNVVHLHGADPMFRFTQLFPVQVINWHDRGTEPTLAQARLMFNGALCGGLDANDHLHLGTPSSIRDAARDAIGQMNGRRLILGAGCAIPITSPLSNIRATRDIV